MSDTSQPPIPNLLETLRTSRGRAGRRTGRVGQGDPAVTHDATIQGTDADAAVSRYSAVEIGYLNDPYAGSLIRSLDAHPTRRLPIINRGTYTRTAALDILVDSFLAGEGTNSESSEKQIISLGAGTDTRPYRLFNKPGQAGLIYHELDFKVTCEKKLRATQTMYGLKSTFPDIVLGEDGSWSSTPAGGQYYCHGIDLRDLTDPSKTILPGLRTDLPTLLLSECCLCYLNPNEATQAMSFFTSQIPNIATVIYEPIKPNDAFGKMMVSNLAARRIQMPTLEVYPEAGDQEKRLRDAGFEIVRHMTIDDIWETWVAPEEKDRLSGVEVLDEVEEWKLLASHYVVVWGSKGDGFGTWGDLGGGA